MRLADVRANEVLRRLSDGEVVGAEVGVERGAMSRSLLRGHPGLTLLMVDSWAPSSEQPAHYRESGDFHAHLSAKEQGRLYRETRDSVEFAGGRARILRMASVDAARDMEGASLDFVFLDADHSYEGVREDIEAWLPKIRAGGLLCGHDYDHEKNVRKGFGVCRAVDEASARHGWTIEAGDNSTWFVRLP